MSSARLLIRIIALTPEQLTDLQRRMSDHFGAAGSERVKAIFARITYRLTFDLVTEDGRKLMIDAVDLAKTTTVVVGEIVRAAGDDPKAKEAARNIGQTAVTITKAINNALLPLAAVNFAFDKAREYFSSEFAKDMTERAAKIPSDNVVEPKPSVAGPAIQGLAFSHQEPNLKDLFLSLLATSMDKTKADTAHPSYVEIIKQISSDEAGVLTAIISREWHTIVQLRYAKGDSGAYNIAYNHLVNLEEDGRDPYVDARVPAMVENFCRLGLFEVTYNSRKHGELYGWVEVRQEYVEAVRAAPDGYNMMIQKGILRRTQFGERFGLAVHLIEGSKDN